jgi:hypothetical protein
MQTYRNAQNKPYKFRSNFENFETESPEEYAALLKLDAFLERYKYINVKTYLKAPYLIHPDIGFIKLKFYNTQKAISYYNMYLKQLESQSPDSKGQLEFIKESLKYIKNFCLENNLTFQDYLKHRKGVSLTWMVDVLSSNISPFLVIGLSYFNIPLEELVQDTPNDECEMFLNDLTYNSYRYKMDLDKSKYAKEFIIRGVKAINEMLKANKKEGIKQENDPT